MALRLSPYHHRLATTVAEACRINTLLSSIKAMGRMMVDMEIDVGLRIGGSWTRGILRACYILSLAVLSAISSWGKERSGRDEGWEGLS